MSFRNSPGRWMTAFVAFAFVVTVATAALMLLRHLQLAGERPPFARVLGWQALIYSAWIPIAAYVWRTFARIGLVDRAMWRYLAVGLIAIPVHAVGATVVDIAFSNPGSADLIAMTVQRLQLDTLIYASFGVLAIAGEFHRRAADEAAAAAAFKAAFDQAAATNEARSAGDDRLFVSVGTKRLAVELQDVEWFGSAANYVVVNWQGREGLIRKTIQALEQELDPLTFARVHRTAVVNLAKVQSAQSLSDGSWRLRLASGAELVASRTYRAQILDRLKLR